jgi:hypothetical protein
MILISKFNTAVQKHYEMYLKNMVSLAMSTFLEISRPASHVATLLFGSSDVKMARMLNVH